MITMISVKCPDCGAALSIEEGRSTAFCTYCGAKVLINNENEFVYRHIDEAKIKEAETDRIIRLKQLEIEENRRKEQEHKENLDEKKIKMLQILWAVLSVLVIVVALIRKHFDGPAGIRMLILVCAPVVFGGAVLVFKKIPQKFRERALLQAGGIRFPAAIYPVWDKNYLDVSNTLSEAGFTNISCVCMHDIVFGIFDKEGSVQSVTVDGKYDDFEGKVFLPSAHIIITYHGR